MLLLHSSMCSDTGTEYGMGGRTWLLGLSDRSVHGVITEVAGSSLTGMGLAKGAGMHCALDRSAAEEEKSNRVDECGEEMGGSGLEQICPRLSIPGPMSLKDSSPLEDIYKKDKH